MNKIDNQKLKRTRMKHGLTQADMAEILGISKVSYNLKENGKREFKQSEINGILDLFTELSYEEIFLSAS